MIKCLSKYKFDSLPVELRISLKRYKYVFNPSYIKNDCLHYLAVRLFDEKSKMIIAKLYVWKDSTIIKEINLTDFFRQNLGCNKVSDTKIFEMNGSVWGSFNTGYVDKGDNSIVLFNVQNETISNYYDCIYTDRNRIEKNWAFFYSNKSIYALYDIMNCKIIKGEIKNEREIVFKTHFQDDVNVLPDFSIGTPLVTLSNDAYGFIGHKKINLKGKRIYLGKAFKFSFDKTPSIKATSGYLVHSLKSLLGEKFKFNKNLISCTYFSGLFLDKKNVHISYGINDLSWAIIKIKKRKLWR